MAIYQKKKTRPSSPPPSAPPNPRPCPCRSTWQRPPPKASPWKPRGTCKRSEVVSLGAWLILRAAMAIKKYDSNKLLNNIQHLFNYFKWFESLFGGVAATSTWRNLHDLMDSFEATIAHRASGAPDQRTPWEDQTSKQRQLGVAVQSAVEIPRISTRDVICGELPMAATWNSSFFKQKRHLSDSPLWHLPSGNSCDPPFKPIARDSNVIV